MSKYPTLCWLFCPGCLAIAILSQCPVLAVLLLLSCFFCAASTFLSQLCCPRCPSLTILSRLFCPSFPDSAVLFLLSCSVLSSLSCPGCQCHILAVVPQPPCPVVLYYLPCPLCPVLAVLSRLSCPNCPSKLSCPCVLSLLSSLPPLSFPVSLVLSRLSRPACSVPLVLSQLPRPVSPVSVVLSRLSLPASPAPAVSLAVSLAVGCAILAVMSCPGFSDLSWLLCPVRSCPAMAIFSTSIILCRSEYIITLERHHCMVCRDRTDSPRGGLCAVPVGQKSGGAEQASLRAQGREGGRQLG
jgi:hypothetical protein